jgi:hypothetical protein
MTRDVVTGRGKPPSGFCPVRLTLELLPMAGRAMLKKEAGPLIRDNGVGEREGGRGQCKPNRAVP